MNKRLKKITLILVGLFVAYIIGSSIFTVVTGYSVEFGNSDEYQFLFKEKYHNALDTISVKDYRKSDYYASCRLNNYYIGIQKIDNLKDIKLSSIRFQKNANLSNIEFYPAQILNRKVNFVPTIRSYWRQSFDSVLNVSFNKHTQVDSVARGKNYISYHAHIDKMLFSNGKNKEMLFYDFSGKS
ncbi:MAG: hypothetical protein K9H84_03005, partial [Bacteroidales bacterium]|nr:hypothetical protein [Bacteroidales bacterium]